MTCDEYLSMLATGSVKELVKDRPGEHAAGCPHCERATRVVMTRESNLVAAFENVYSNTPASVTADVALAKSRQRDFGRMYFITWAIASAIVVAIVVWFAASRVHFARPGDDATVAPVAEQAFLLRCLSPGQAAELLRPYLGPDGMLRISVGAPGVLTIRATQDRLRKAKSILNRYEHSPDGVCPAQAAPAVTR
jgi:hypothetical protein